MSSTAIAPLVPPGGSVEGESGPAVMKRNGRTFWLASRLLSAPVARDTAVLYAFCRYADDAIDEASTAADARRQSVLLAAELNGEAAARPSVAAFLALTASKNIDVRYAHELTAGIASDLGPVRVCDDEQLIHYGYLVAGTVGAMMLPILSVTDPRALEPATHLGIAMQLTNICRDVAEDAARDRVYLPESRLRAAGLSHSDILAGTADRAQLAIVVRDTLALADRYYASARHGLCYLPLRARLTVAIAGEMYRAIGVRLLRRQAADPFAGRVVVPLQQKFFYAGRALLNLLLSGPAAA